MMLRKPILFPILCAVMAVPALANPARYAITADEVAAAVSDQGTPVAPSQIVLLTDVVADVAVPELKVKSIDSAGPERATARLECVDSAQCLPFVVSIRMPANSSLSIAATSSHLLPAAVSRNRPAPIVVHAGSPAMLLLDGPHVHISLTVICLQNGSPGQFIQATDHDRHQKYIARVTQDGLLEGRL